MPNGGTADFMAVSDVRSRRYQVRKISSWQIARSAEGIDLVRS
jgi:hypothetical protein